MQLYLEEVYAAWVERQQVEGRKPTASKPIPFGAPLYFSLDNASVHKAAYTDPTWLEKHSWARRASFGEIQPPPYSPDCHKVIEHIHATITKAFKAKVDKLPHTLETVEEYWEMVKALFYEAITADSVRKDVDSLLKTYKAVIELGGHYPSKELR